MLDNKSVNYVNSNSNNLTIPQAKFGMSKLSFLERCLLSKYLQSTYFNKIFQLVQILRVTSHNKYDVVSYVGRCN